ncbi:hypothetical protein ACRRTK_008444 [Alexandromys fortis]
MVGGRRRHREADMVSVRVAPGGGGARAESAAAEQGPRPGGAGGRAGSPGLWGCPSRCGDCGRLWSPLSEGSSALAARLHVWRGLGGSSGKSLSM